MVATIILGIGMLIPLYTHNNLDKTQYPTQPTAVIKYAILHILLLLFTYIDNKRQEAREVHPAFGPF